MRVSVTWESSVEKKGGTERNREKFEIVLLQGNLTFT